MIWHGALVSPDNALAPREVGRGVVSTKYDSVGYAEASDGTVIFVRRCPGTLLCKTVLCQTRHRGARWEKPSVLPFSGSDDDFGPQFSTDGHKLYFVSNRGHRRKFTIWSADRTDKGWAKPLELGSTVNGKGHQFSVSPSSTGNLFVCSTRTGAGALFEVPLNGHGYGEAKPIEEINRVGYIYEACVAPDESFAIFSAIGGKDEMIAPGAIYNRGDLYLSRHVNGVWQAPVHLPPPVNTVAGETGPSLSPDGKALYFASDRGFMTHRGKEPLTYTRLRRLMHTTQNCESKIYEVRLFDVLNVNKETPTR